MSNINQIVKSYLEENPFFRERRNRARGIARMLIEKHNLLNMSENILEVAIIEADSYSRAWRKILSENTELRGADYDAKYHLEDEHLQALGYAPKHN
jgi:hypothetical protein